MILLIPNNASFPPPPKVPRTDGHPAAYKAVDKSGGVVKGGCSNVRMCAMIMVAVERKLNVVGGTFSVPNMPTAYILGSIGEGQSMPSPPSLETLHPFKTK